MLAYDDTLPDAGCDFHVDMFHYPVYEGDSEEPLEPREEIKVCFSQFT
jgi:hypothetical protein